MFGKHVRKELSAYAHGELSAERAEHVVRHLGLCESCRKEFDAVSFGIHLVEHLPQADAPASLWESLEVSLIKQQAEEKTALKSSLLKPSPRLAIFKGRRQLAFASLVVILLFGAGTFLLYRRATRPAWEVTSIEGAPSVDSKLIKKKGMLAVGMWLETDAGSRARLSVADIGQVEIEPETRVRLVETGLTEHRLELERGRIHARIWAPPRLFFVNTPSAVAEDLGCAYTLEVDDTGRSLLRVTSGWVALVLNERESVVPAGAACATEPGTGPGTPFFEDASEAFTGALARLDFDRGGSDALQSVLSEARTRDTLTLWHLVSRVEGEDRARVYDKLAALAPPPMGVTREGTLALDREMLDAWRAELEATWSSERFPKLRRTWRDVWKKKK